MNVIEARREHVITRREAGWTWTRIGQEMGLSGTRVGVLYKLGLKDREKRAAAEAQAAATPDTAVRDLGLSPALAFALIHIGCTDVTSVLTRDPDQLRRTLLRYPNVSRRVLAPLERLLDRFCE